MPRKTTPTAKIITGGLIVLFQATANRSSVMWCFTAECIGYNAVGLGLWALGVWFLYAGIRDTRRGKTGQDTRTNAG